MRPKSGLPKRRPIRSDPEFEEGFRATGQPAFDASPERIPGVNQPIQALSLFAGCGGLDLGIEGGFRFNGEDFPRLPYRIELAIDNSPDAVEAYKLNLDGPAVQADLTEVDMADLPQCDLLLGGFPCQDFSSAGRKRGLEGERGRLYRVLARYMRQHRPRLVVAENVPHLKRMRNGKILRVILDELSSEGYRFDVWDLDCRDYGLPQNRRRIFLIGIRDDLLGFPVPPAPKFVGCHRGTEWAIGDLECVVDESVTNQSQYFVATKATAGAGQGDQTCAADEPAYCVRANARARVHFHYRLPRRLTVRECARLQSFPDQFVFPFSAMRNMTLIGNAVPPMIGHVVGKSIARYWGALSGGDADGIGRRVSIVSRQEELFAEARSE